MKQITYKYISVTKGSDRWLLFQQEIMVKSKLKEIKEVHCNDEAMLVVDKNKPTDLEMKDD